MNIRITLLAMAFCLLFAQGASAELEGIWLPDCANSDISSSSKSPMLLITPLYFNDYYQVLFCYRFGCLNTTYFERPTTIYGDERFRNITEGSFSLTITGGYSEIDYYRCDDLTNELDALRRESGYNKDTYKVWNVDQQRKTELQQKASSIDYSNPIAVLRAWLDAVTNEEYDFIPYLVIPEHLLYFSPPKMKRIRASIQLPENPEFTLRYGVGSNRAGIRVPGTKYGFMLQKRKGKWLLVQ